jgi:hypothetical protein
MTRYESSPENANAVPKFPVPARNSAEQILEQTSPGEKCPKHRRRRRRRRKIK